MDPLRRPSEGRNADIARPVWIAAVYATMIVIVLVLLATVPVPETSGFRVGGSVMAASPYGPPPPVTYSVNDRWPRSLCPAGAHAPVDFTSRGWNGTRSILAPSGTPLWATNGTPGAVAFVVPTCGTFDFLIVGGGTAVDPFYRVDVTLSYSAPIL